MKLYRFRYSPYARKVQMLLDLLGRALRAHRGPLQRPRRAGDAHRRLHLRAGAGRRRRHGGHRVARICEHLLVGRRRPQRLVPSPLEGPIWAYADFVDGPLEDVLFRIASPAVRDAWPTAGERALYVLIKERKFGAGCVDAWERDRDAARGAGARSCSAPTRAHARGAAVPVRRRAHAGRRRPLRPIRAARGGGVVVARAFPGADRGRLRRMDELAAAGHR